MTDAPAQRTPKRERTRLAKAEMWLHLAVTAQRWADDIVGTDPMRVRPFAEWGSDDPLVRLCAKYDLSPRDLSRIITRIAGQLESQAIRSGYDEVDP